MSRASQARPPRGSTEIDGYFDSLIARVPDPAHPNGSTAATSSSLGAVHLAQLSTDLSVSVDDVVMYVLAWKLDAKVPMTISKEEWSYGLYNMRIHTLADLRAALPALRADVAAPPQFKAFYYFLFDWTRESAMARIIPNDVALVMWPLAFSSLRTPWAHFGDWMTYIETVYRKPVSRDLWRQTLEYTLVNPLAEDPNGAWPSAMDDFAEWLRKGKPTPVPPPSATAAPKGGSA